MSESLVLNKQPLEAVFRPALMLMTGRLLGFLAAFVIPVVLVRIFDQAEFGSYKQVFLIFGTLFGMAQAGMAESLYYFLPSAPRRAGSYVFNALLALTAMGTLSLAMLWLWQEELVQLLNNPGLAEYVPMVGLYLLLMLVAVVLEILMTIRRQHFGAGASYALSDLLRALFYITPVLWYADLRALMYGAIGFALVRFSATLIYVTRQYATALRPDAIALRKHLGYAIPFGLAGVIEVIQVNYHLYAVSYYFDAAKFAIYAIGCLQIPLSDFLMTSTCNVMMVNMREKIHAEDYGAAANIWQDCVRKLALVFFPLVVCLLLIAHPLILLLFTSDYEDSVPIFMIWTLSMLFTSLLTDGVLRVLAETRFLIVQNLIRLGMIVIFIPWFLMRFDLMGAVLVSLMALMVTRIIALGRIRFVLGLTLKQLLPWKSLAWTFLIAIAAALPALLPRTTINAPEIVLLCASVTIYGFIYYFLLQWFGPMQKEEKQMLSQWFKSPFIRLTASFKP